MAAPAPTVSNPFVVTVDAAPPSITLTGTPAEVPPAGGAVALSGATNLPDGTTLHLLLNGTDTGQTAVTSSGAYSFSYAIPPNATLNPITDTFTVST
jgi:hypothetical protein